mmetsp:Transcript_22081/g.39595  ORF Transcript_22081/g.39595 Transcript_22081/m.39595 type:complete len:627 (-) Transcript_22081:145-2025(-)
MDNDAVKGGIACCTLGWGIFFIVMLASIRTITDQQQVVWKTPTGRTVQNGQFTQIIWPHTPHEVRDATRLTMLQYATIIHERTQKKRNVGGPVLEFLDAYDKLEGIYDKYVLQKREYIRLVDDMTGEERVVAGEAVLVPEPLEKAPFGIETCIVVGASNAVLVENKTSGMKSLITQKGMFVPRPHERIIEEKFATLLDPQMYAVVKDHLTGKTQTILGPTLLQVGPYEELLRVDKKALLEKDQYIRLLNKKTGSERVISGPAVVVPDPSEEAEAGVEQAIFLTSQTAVKVLNRTSGQQRLIDTEGVFFPEPYERVLEVQNKIRVLPHQACVLRSITGNVTLMSGEAGATAFFLPPFTSMVEFQWSFYKSRDVKLPAPKETITMLDLRVQKLFFSNEVRTSDNVKLRMNGTVFWKVTDVMQMLSMSSDLPGDISQRTASSLIQAVSQNTLSVFMENFNAITQTAFSAQVGDTFYSDRGVELQNIEVTGYDCVDEETALVLQDIIKRTTMRINELQVQESENEVAAAKLEGEIELEKKRTELITTQAGNEKLLAEFQGQSSGAKLVQSAATFIDGLGTSVPNVTSRVTLYKLLQKVKSRNADTKNLAQGKAQLFMTPEDLDLKLNSEL